VPQVRWRRAGDKGVSDRQLQGVERTGAIAPDDHVPREKILHRTTIRVKLHRAIVVNSKLANRNKILDKLRAKLAKQERYLKQGGQVAPCRWQ